ncbi:MAG: Alpha/Beta hydrolase protein [Monoraphidium minutum]|nr:MAG: Alpha/Beta hydrolase protein [Monoraphidium minutum]
MQGTPLAGLISLPVHDICPIVKEITALSPSSACMALGVLMNNLQGRRSPGTPTECTNRNATGYGPQVEPADMSPYTGEPVPKPLPDARPMPPTFTPRRVRMLLTTEAPTWGWLWALVNNLLNFSMCAKGAGGRLDYLVPRGWTPVGPYLGETVLPGVYYLPQADGSLPMPFMAIVKSEAGDDGHGGQLVIVFRGTNSGPEWQLDFAYNRVSRARFPGKPFVGNFFEGETHAGFTNVFNILWPHVREALDREVIAGARLRSVTVAGHSMGAAAATLVSYAAQRYLDVHRPGVVVSALMAACPNVGNAAFAKAHGMLVNSRRFTFVNDAITLVPCLGGEGARGMPACASTPVRTDKGLKAPASTWTGYTAGYGSIVVDGDFMPAQAAAWARTDRLPMLDLGTAEALTGAGHVCSYDCFFSQCWTTASGQPVNSSCLLVPGPAREAAGQSFCYGFPRAGFTL